MRKKKSIILRISALLVAFFVILFLPNSTVYAGTCKSSCVSGWHLEPAPNCTDKNNVVVPSGGQKCVQDYVSGGGGGNGGGGGGGGTVPTATPVPPTSTPSVTPTRTPTPSLTPTRTPTPTTNPTPTRSPTPTTGPTVTPVVLGDADGNGVVTFKDYFYFASHRSGATIPAIVKLDFNKDGLINNVDRDTLIQILLPQL